QAQRVPLCGSRRNAEPTDRYRRQDEFEPSPQNCFDDHKAMLTSAWCVFGLGINQSHRNPSRTSGTGAARRTSRRSPTAVSKAGRLLVKICSSLVASAALTEYLTPALGDIPVLPICCLEL